MRRSRFTEEQIIDPLGPFGTPPTSRRHPESNGPVHLGWMDEAACRMMDVRGERRRR